jgi:hypothetical protein
MIREEIDDIHALLSAENGESINSSAARG